MRNEKNEELAAIQTAHGHSGHGDEHEENGHGESDGHGDSEPNGHGGH